MYSRWVYTRCIQGAGADPGFIKRGGHLRGVHPTKLVQEGVQFWPNVKKPISWAKKGGPDPLDPPPLLLDPPMRRVYTIYRYRPTLVSGQNPGGQKPIGQYPSGQNPRKTKTQGDKSPGGQYPSETKTKGDKSPGGQTPTGTKTHGGQYPRVQNPRGTKSQDLCICIRNPGACVYCRGFAGLKAWLEMWQKWHQKSLVLLVTKFKFGV